MSALAFWFEERLAALRRLVTGDRPFTRLDEFGDDLLLPGEDEDRPRPSHHVKAPSGADRRTHERFGSTGCTVRIDSTVYQVLDVSLGGFTFGPDQGLLIPNQRFYFELRFPGDHPGAPVRADGKVVRVNGNVVAAKFFLPLATTRRLIASFVAHNRDLHRHVGAGLHGGSVYD